GCFLAAVLKPVYCNPYRTRQRMGGSSVLICGSAVALRYIHVAVPRGQYHLAVAVGKTWIEATLRVGLRLILTRLQPGVRASSRIT
ncbi:MAG: hypothetical protein ABR556_14330, partial [Pyrinomonadaceae bacterium]